MKKYLWLLFIPFLIAAAPTKVNNFSSQTTIRSAEVNTNFDDLYEYLSTGVDTIRADGIDAITEFKSTIRSGSDQTIVTGTKGTNEQFAIWNGDGDLVAITTMTGNATGIKMTVTPTISSLLNCSSLGTNSVGQLTCN